MRSTSLVPSPSLTTSLAAGSIAIVIALFAALFLIVAPPPPAAHAATSNPPDPAPVFVEDFQNTGGPTPILRVDSYTGAGPTAMTYTAHSDWLRECNGWVVSMEQDPNAAAQTSDCTNPFGDLLGWNSSQRMAYALGLFAGESPADAEKNYALSEHTTGPPDAGSGLTVLQTARTVPLTSTDRFLMFSVDVADVYCQYGHPQLRFELIDDTGAATQVGGVADACTSTTELNPPGFGHVGMVPIKVGTYTSGGALRYTGSSVGVRVINDNGGSSGNDAVLDNLRILDATPHLEAAFGASRVEAGSTTSLTFTVLNTSDLTAKSGWGFSAALPSGLTLASSTVGGTCTGTTAATAGGSSLSLSGSAFATGDASCTVSVDVTSSNAAAYALDGSDITTTALNTLESAAKTTFADPSFTVSKTASKASAAAGDTISYTIAVTNTGSWAYDSSAPAGRRQASFVDDLSGIVDDATYGNDVTGGAVLSGSSLSWSGALALGETKTFTYSATVRSPAPAGDGLVRGAVSPGSAIGGSCAPGPVGANTCLASTAVRAYVVTTTATVTPGPAVSYTVTVTNTGQYPFTASDPAAFSDDLSGLFDDAVYNGDASNGGVVTGSTLRWSGPLAVGTSQTVTFSVKAKAGGDGRLLTALMTSVDGNCAVGSTASACTSALAAPALPPALPLAVTGMDAAWSGLVATVAALMILVGTVMAFGVRRRSAREQRSNR